MRTFFYFSPFTSLSVILTLTGADYSCQKVMSNHEWDAEKEGCACNTISFFGGKDSMDMHSHGTIHTVLAV